MREFEVEFALPELRADQILIHIPHLGCGSPQAGGPRQPGLHDAKLVAARGSVIDCFII